MFLKLLLGRPEKVFETCILPCRYTKITRSSLEEKVSKARASESFDDTPKKVQKLNFLGVCYALATMSQNQWKRGAVLQTATTASV